AVETDATASVVVSTSFTYDVFGNRIGTTGTQAGVTVTTKSAFEVTRPPQVGDDLTGWRLYADLNGVGSVVTRYLSGLGVNQWLAQIVAGAGTRWTLADYQGSIRLVTDSSGVVIDTINYDAFGTITWESNSAVGGKLKYAGYEQDTWTGMYRAGIRNLL